MPADRKITILVSSTIYDYEGLLDSIYSLLTLFGYEVWMSHKGTMPVFSDRTTFENCIAATENCDLFLGIITPRYGSGICKNGLSITHNELKKAIDLKKPRWILAHDNVFFAHTFLNSLGFKGKSGRMRLPPLKKPFFDLRTIDMFEDATISEESDEDRQGNWVQKFKTDPDAMLFASGQFSRYQDVEEFLKEHFQNYPQVSDEKNDGEDLA